MKVAKLVNDGKTDINITLDKNIDLTDIDWTPICPDDNKQYTGIFDGKNYTITGLTVTGDDLYAGLFGYTGKGSTVKNVKLNGVQIESDNWMSYAGGVVGCSYGTIENCSVSGNVIGRGSNSCAGGVVGSIVGGSITGCSSSATVNSKNYAGGVSGGVSSGVTMTGCYATGSVTCSGDSYIRAGGITGNNGSFCTLIACYATGSVTGSGSGTIYVGGVTGENYSGIVTACYHAQGTVSGSEGTTGGVTGRNYKSSNAPDITACYWENNQEQGIGENQAGTGETTKVDGTVTWQTAVDAMNAALSGKGWQYELTGALPTLKKQ